MSFRSIRPTEIQENLLRAIDEDHMLLVAGTAEDFNPMTASSGGIGNFWRKDITYCYVRPDRYTKQFMDVPGGGFYTLCFFDSSYADVLTMMGRVSGLEEDKTKKAGLTPLTAASGAVYYEEARLVLVCKTICASQVNPRDFLDESLEDYFRKKDYHTMYCGEILEVLVKEN